MTLHPDTTTSPFSFVPTTNETTSCTTTNNNAATITTTHVLLLEEVYTLFTDLAMGICESWEHALLHSSHLLYVPLYIPSSTQLPQLQPSSSYSSLHKREQGENDTISPIYIIFEYIPHSLASCLMFGEDGGAI